MRSLDRFEHRDLGSPGRQFLGERLKSSGPLGVRLSALGLNGGEVFTFATPDVTRERLFQFENGGVASRGPFVPGPGYVAELVQRPSEQRVADLLAEGLTTDPKAIVIAEEGFGSGASPWLSKLDGSGMVVAPFGASDLFLVVTAQHERQALDAVLKQVNSWEGFPVLAVPNNPVDWTHLTEGDLDEVARTARLLAVPAYDAEGYVLWSRYSDFGPGSRDIRVH